MHFQWPPKELNEDCDIEGSIKLCHERCKVDLGEVKRFELSTDLGNLPNSQELKCYLYCFMESCGVFQKNSTRLNLEFVMNKIEKLPREKQDIVFGMGRLTQNLNILFFSLFQMFFLRFFVV